MSIPEKPLKVGPSPKVERPVKTYFYEINGAPVCVQEVEAWTLHKKYKQLGVSDGTHYSQRLEEAKRILSEKGLEEAQKVLREAFSQELEIARGHFQMPPNPDRVEFIQR